MYGKKILIRKNTWNMGLCKSNYKSGKESFIYKLNNAGIYGDG